MNLMMMIANPFHDCKKTRSPTFQGRSVNCKAMLITASASCRRHVACCHLFLNVIKGMRLEDLFFVRSQFQRGGKGWEGGGCMCNLSSNGIGLQVAEKAALCNNFLGRPVYTQNVKVRQLW